MMPPDQRYNLSLSYRQLQTNPKNRYPQKKKIEGEDLIKIIGFFTFK